MLNPTIPKPCTLVFVQKTQNKMQNSELDNSDIIQIKYKIIKKPHGRFIPFFAVALILNKKSFTRVLQF
jgi:hypothetical protein